MIERDVASVTFRRERAARLTHLGWTAEKIAFDLGVNIRTVQRYRDQARIARPVGRPKEGMRPETLRIMKTIMDLTAKGWTSGRIAPIVNLSPRTVRNYRGRWRKHESSAAPQT